ncbi:MAG TPA: hypothetical protein VF980_20885 [Thermoanaerobaculia bacterium]
MRGRVIAVLLSFFLLSSGSAFSQCDYRLQFSGEYRASVFDIWIDGNDLWTASGYGVQLYDRTIDPPRLTGSVRIPGLTRLVRAANGVAYAGGSAGLSVVRKSGGSLQFVRTIPLASANDLVLGPIALFVATSAGVIELDPLDPLNPSRSQAAFPTSNTAVSSLAMIGSTLYAADGDSTIESFSIVVPSSPQKSASFPSLAHVTSVKAAGTRLYASDGQRTEVFAVNGGTLISAGILPFVATSIAEAETNIVAIAGNDRQIHVIDASVPESYIELFTTELPPTAGTVNRISAIQIAGGRMYVAAGDGGLATYDLSRFAPPFPLRAYGSGTATSVVVLSEAVYVGRTPTGIQELVRSPSSGNLVVQRQWSPASETVQDGAAGLLLSSSGATLTFWTLVSTIPTSISQATFRANVRGAALDGSTAIVLLDDGTLWTADMSQTAPAPLRVASGGGSLSQLAHSGNATAATEVSTNGTTTIHDWNSNDLNIAPVNATVPGAATALALNGSTAAVFTFRGITVVDMTTGAQLLLPGSNSALVVAVKIANGKVIALTDQSTVRIWNMANAALEKEIVVPGPVFALDAAEDSTFASVATATGVAAIDYGSSSSLPALIGRGNGNAYFKKAAASASRLYLFDGRLIEIYELASTPAPHWIGSLLAPGTIDLAASDTSLFTVSSSGVVSEYSAAGVLVRSKALDEGADAAPAGIVAIGGAPWVSFTRGCTTTGCEKRAAVLDPQSLVRTALLPGGVVDAAASGTRAYAIFDIPSELRVYDVADPLHPSTVASRATDVAAVAIAYSSGTIYLLADKAYAYSESSLTRTGEQLTAASPSSAADLVVDSGCATIVGRSAAAAETYALPQWTPGAPLQIPGAVRTMKLSGGRLLILTDYSIEIWSRTAAPAPARRRGAGGNF